VFETRAAVVFRDDVVTAIEAGDRLAPDVKKVAVALARELSDTPGDLSGLARQLAKKPDGKPESYAIARRAAEAACKSEPGNSSHAITLGLAQYRCGLYGDAVTTLGPAVDQAAKGGGPEHPFGLAILAMAQAKSGSSDQASGILAKLRQAIAKLPASFIAEVQDARALFREAEEMLRDK